MTLPYANKKSLSNNFDFLRFLSSLFVIISHSYALLGKENEDPLLLISNRTYHFSSLGLICFFVISGYFVSQSLFRSSSIINYVWKRFLRIIPALCLTCIFCVVIIGPLFTSLNWFNYFNSINTYTYFRNILIIFPLQWGLPGLFINNPEKSVNGSLWTLTLEGRLYLILIIIKTLGILKKRLFTAVLFLSMLILSPWFNSLIDKSYYTYFCFCLYFLAGLIAFLYKERIVYNKWLFIIALLVVIVRCFNDIVNPLLFISFPYIILYLGKQPSILNHFGKYGDFSYGMFLFSFPIQQCIIDVSHSNISAVYLMLLSIVFTLPFAVFSWKFIESKSLKYKQLMK